MSETGSWLHNSASKLSKHRQIAGKLVAGAGIVSLVLMGYAYGPATADKREAVNSTPGVPTSAPVVLAQAPSAAEQKLIPQPQPANVPPPTAKDFASTAQESADKKIQALIPLPEPANVPPLTASDIARESTVTATVPTAPAAAPKLEATAPAAAPAQETVTSTPASEPQLNADEIKKLTGKDLIKAPLAATLSTADHGIALKLREVLAGRADRFFDRREERQAVEAFYRDRGFVPLWIENASIAPRTTSVAKYLSGIGADGLEPSDYPVPSFSAADAQALADAELRLTNSILDYARHAQTGRVHFSRMSGDVHYELQLPDPAATLSKMAAASDVSPALAEFNPPHEGYKALKGKLAEARGGAPEKEVIRIPEGATMKPGMEDSRVPLLRKRLEISGNLDSHRYDDDVAKAVMAFQKNANLTPDGFAGPATIRAINGPARGSKVDAILATMERWRWMPRDLGRNYSILNIPDFTVKVVKNGTPIWQTRVVVGKSATKTPLISDTMKFITVNPTWNVPPSIIANEYLPALQQDPGVLDRMGLRLEQNRDGTVRIYQPPGDSNALGRVRFNFPNKFLVYQHDTPDKHLFAKDVRAFSHGCMRVQDPVKYAEVVLSLGIPGENFTEQSIRGMFGPSERNINFVRPLPVHITYQTAYVDGSGKLVIRDDIYGHDAALMSQLKGGERRVADVPVVRRQASYSREELRMPNGVYYGSYDGPGRGYGRNPVEDFFRSIFR
jgi:murein L,D-transpeptidase YcbB/YkuD